jgi:eukaryotic-like serine/threonine-protein kinase
LFQEAAVGIEKRRFQPQNARLIIDNLINCYEQQKQFDQAEVWRRKWLAVVKERTGADSLPYAGELTSLGLNLLRQKKWADAEPVLRECLALRESKQPDAWTTFNTRSLLGGALLGLAQSASKEQERTRLLTDAEPLLLKGYEGMKAREKTIPVQGMIRVPEAIDRLIELYTATNKPDEVKKWHAERAKYVAPVAPLPPVMK